MCGKMYSGGNTFYFLPCLNDFLYRFSKSDVPYCSGNPIIYRKISGPIIMPFQSLNTEDSSKRSPAINFYVFKHKLNLVEKCPQKVQFKLIIPPYQEAHL